MDNHPASQDADNGTASANTHNVVPVNGAELQEESDLDWLNNIPNGTIFSYNLDDSKTPGGLKVRFKVRVATGPEAARWDARQTEAIRELLQWAAQRQQTP